MVLIASFDVFDTVITRKVGSPFSLFLFLGKCLNRKGMIHYSPETFAFARINAERRAFLNFGERLTLTSIYSELASALYLDEEQAQQIMIKEMEMEEEFICKIPQVEERIQEKRERLKKVVFISDMYLPTEFIQKQLKIHNLWHESDKCYVSCEYQCSKETGRLFEKVAVCEGVSLPNILHYGNNHKADVDAAKRLGIKVIPFYEGNLNRYEKILESYSCQSEGLTSLMAGASRLARLHGVNNSVRENVLRQVAAGVIAPTLTGYVLWVLRQALQNNIKSLYFVSRDGQILIEIANRLIKKLHISIETHYLYGSRQAWHLPSVVSEIGDKELEWIFDNTTFLSIRSLLTRVDIEPEEIKDQLYSMGFHSEDWDRNLNDKERNLLRGMFVENAYVRNLITEKARKKRELVINYLSQEGLLSSQNWGIVDIGWNGRITRSLDTIMRTVGKTVPLSLFFGLNHSPENSIAYFYNKSLHKGFTHLIPNLIPIMEVFCSADHGSVIGYTMENNKVIPLLKEPFNKMAIEFGLPVIHETIKMFVDHLDVDYEYVNPWIDIREAINELLKSFILAPDYNEASVWGSFVFVDDQGENSPESLAREFSWIDVGKTLLSGKMIRRHRGEWTTASMILTPFLRRKTLRLALEFNRIFRKVINRFKVY